MTAYHLRLLSLAVILTCSGCESPPPSPERTALPSESNSIPLTGTWDVRWQSLSFIFNEPTEVFGFLNLSETSDGYHATFRGEPVDVTIDGDNIKFTYEEALRSEGGGRRGQVSLTFTGTISGKQMSGTLSRIDGVIHEDAIGQVSNIVTEDENAAPGYMPETLAIQEFLPVKLNVSEQWQATRLDDTITDPSIDGVWIPRPEFSNDWLRDVNAVMTEEGKRRKQSWHPFDDPALRCASSGLVRISGNPLPIIITSGDWEVSLLFEDEHAIQHVYTDGRPMLEDWIPSGMGYSVGHWDGATLEIETRWLLGNWIAARGIEHQGDETTITERYTMTQDGKYLLAELTLDDPLTYTQPLRRVRGYERNINALIYPYECDSYTFFYGLNKDGRTDNYFNKGLKY